MLKYSRASFKKKIIISCLISFTIYCIISIVLVGQSIDSKQLEIDNVNQSIEHLEAQNTQLSKVLEQGIDYDYIAKMAKEKLGLISPNERLYIDVHAQS